MKKVLLGLIVLTSVSAFAGNEGPSAAPQLPPPIVAKVQIASFFHPPDSPDTVRVEIAANGKVTRTEVYMRQNNKVVVKQIAKLAPSVIKSLIEHANKVVAGELKDPNPKEPGCMDAPSITYTAINQSGEIDIAERQACKEMEKENATFEDQAVRSALDAALDLSNLAR
jgi:hypothetical protein